MQRKNSNHRPRTSAALAANSKVLEWEEPLETIESRSSVSQGMKEKYK